MWTSLVPAVVEQSRLENTPWAELSPKSPSYLFIPQDVTLESVYRNFTSVPEIFSINSVGIVTARDSLTIHWSPDEVWKTVTVFSRMEPELARKGFNLGKDVQDWKVDLAQKDLLDSGPTRENITPVLYRPFDVRYTYYTGRSRGFICMPRPEVMRHMLAGKNLALITARSNKSPTMDHFFISHYIVETKCGESTVQSCTFPLYLYPDADRSDLFAHQDASRRRPNLNPSLLAALAAAFGRQPSPEDVFHYIYAVLYAPAYRQKYAEFLRIDFPRVPFTAEESLFTLLASFGKDLTDLHLLRSPALDPPACRFQGTGDNRLAKGRKKGLHYDPDQARVVINPTQYFAPVPPDVWSYRVGGYQVCEKWLKDRKDRRLDLDDIRTYCRVVSALKCTLAVQQEIDALYPELEKNILSLTAPAQSPTPETQPKPPRRRPRPPSRP